MLPPIYVGRWTKHAGTNIFNCLILTLPDKLGFVVLAVLAILVTHASSQYWTIVRFTIYWYLKPYRRTASDYVRRLGITLRNSPTPITTLLRYIQAVWRCKDLGWRSLRPIHITSVSVLALTHAICFTLLGCLLPLALIDPAAKIRGVNCGYWPVNATRITQLAGQGDRRDELIELARFVSTGTSFTSAYVKTCYGSEVSLSDCNFMINRQIPWKAIHNAQCPFNKGECIGESNAFTMDTGEILPSYFGINTKSTLTMHHESTCAPILMKPYQVTTEAGTGYSHLSFFGQNITELVRNDMAEPYFVRGWSPQPGLKVHPNLWPARDAVGNVSVIYISRRNITHLFPSDDPIFKAREEVPLPIVSVGYVPNWEDRVGAIACVEKLQLCTGAKKTKKCSPWTGVVRGSNGETGIEDFYQTLSLEDKGLVSLLLPKTPVLQTIGDAARGARSDLVATQSLLYIPLVQSEIQTAKGDDQWKAEVAQWFNIVLAVSQLAVVHFPISPPFQNTSLLENEIPFESRFICNNVMVTAISHTSIRLTGFILIALGAGLAPIFSFLGTILVAMGRNHLPQPVQSWVEDSPWELQEPNRDPGHKDSTPGLSQ